MSSDQNQRLDGRVALVTGAGSGIGRAIATRYGAAGAHVFALDRDLDSAERAAAAIVAAGGRAAAIACDVTDAAAVAAAVARVSEQGGGIDVVVNNAGISVLGAVHTLSEQEWDRQLDVNVKSVFLVSRAVWPHLVERGGGALLNTGSVLGLRAERDDAAAYCASKAAVLMLTRCMALDGAAHGIRSNAVCPGYVTGPMLDHYTSAQPDAAAARAAVAAQHPLGWLGEPADVAEAFLYLASDAARWVTGAVLSVDGGMSVA
ncbi:MAG TPA: glucose 1-dehydrogenase [Conexibacter sp.]|nr:glucose 1-dehydrogenase [Conexibacter sp.]